MRQIILASASPRRKDILEKFGLEFIIIPSSVDEVYDKKDDPIEVVTQLALKKCKDVSNNNETAIVIAADTIVYHQEILGKAKNRIDAFDILKTLSGKTHKVITAIAIKDIASNKEIVDYQETQVKFRTLSDEKIERYLNTEEYIDKAGAYGIQGYGEILVESINGSFSNVVGLPIAKLDEILEENFNIKLL